MQRGSGHRPDRRGRSYNWPTVFTALLRALAISLLLAEVASAEVVRIEIRRRDGSGTHERLIGRVHFAVDPTAPANRGIADLALAPRNASGLVEFASDLLLFKPTDPHRARGTVFLEIVNRGRDQSLALMSGARQRDLSPESWDLGDRFLLEQGFTAAFLGWQFDVRPPQGLTFQAPVAPVSGVVRASHVERDQGRRNTAFALMYCAVEPEHRNATLSFRARIDGAPRLLPREAWQFGPNGCSVRLESGFAAGLYEAIYQARGSPVAGLGLAAMRDFASYLKYGARGAGLRENPALLQRVIGFGYSQSGRFLREFVRDGFNEDERGRAAFDGLMIASAGAGGGSFNHRFAMPGQAGNSVLSILRPVDVPPFTDDELLARARAARVTPRIVYTFSSTEYWARAGSLTHTSDDGGKDVPLAATSRLYFLAGTPHASGPLPPSRDTATQRLRHDLNFAQQRWVLRALLVSLDAWIRSGTEPPASRYPTVSGRELVVREAVQFPRMPSLRFADYLPPVWKMDFGPDYATTRVITKEPPARGDPYTVLVPQVNADGNDVAGVRLPEVAVPLGTFTGWNVTVPPLSELRYLAGLVGSFHPLARTREERDRSGDPRPSIAERYAGRQDYLDQVARASQDLVGQRFLLAEDVPAVLRRAEDMWSAVVDRGGQ
jgi:Alpha/beta hydrolase domain